MVILFFIYVNKTLGLAQLSGAATNLLHIVADHVLFYSYLTTVKLRVFDKRVCIINTLIVDMKKKTKQTVENSE